METVAKLMTQLDDGAVQQMKIDMKNSDLTNGMMNGGLLDNRSPKELRKDQRKKWKNWGWKYSPSSKPGSIEEEPDLIKKSSSSPKQQSPNSSPKHQKLKEEITAPPIRRKKNINSPNQSPSKKSEIRSSAGARLYQILDGIEIDNSDDELQALLSSSSIGRPASIHVIQSSNGHIQF